MIEAMFQPGFQQMQPCNAKQILIHTFESAISSLEVSRCQSIVFSPTNFHQTIDYYSITTPSIGMISTPIDSKLKVLPIYDDNSAWYSKFESQFFANKICLVPATHAFRSIDVFDFSNTTYFDSIEKFACVFFYICDRSSDLFLEYLFLDVLKRMRTSTSINRYSKNRSELRCLRKESCVSLFCWFWGKFTLGYNRIDI